MTPLVFTHTDEAARVHGVKVGVHSRGGIGKTTLVQTLHEHELTGPTLLLSAESGVLSLRHVRIPQITISTFAEMWEAYRFITQSEHAKQFRSIALDSVSEIGERCLETQKGLYNDGRKAYGELYDEMIPLIKSFRDLQRFHVYFSAKQEYVKDEVSGVTRYGPSLPGRKLTQEFPYLFDELFSLEIGQTQDGRSYRFLRTQPDIQFEAKDRSGALDPIEEPHLGKVIEKILRVAA